VGINADLPRLLRDVIAVCRDPRLKVDPRHLYRSILPFLPGSSRVLAYYNKLSDPIRVLRVDGGNHKIRPPLNITPQPNKVPKRDDAPTTPIACVALSDDGLQVALGFRNGVVEVVDVERGVMTSRFLDGPPNPLAWLSFVNNGCQLVTENSNGDICLLDNITSTSRRLPFASRRDGAQNVMTSLSHDGSMIARVAQRSGTKWYENASLIHISPEVPTINALAAPSLDALFLDYPISWNYIPPSFPLRRSMGFSPDGQYVAAFDTRRAFVWSSASFQVVAQYSIDDPQLWFLNTNRQSVTSLAELSDQPVITLDHEPGSIVSSSCVLLTLQRQSSCISDTKARATVEMVSRITGPAPLLLSGGGIWLRGHRIAILPAGYHDPNLCSLKLLSWLGPPRDELMEFTLPTSRDGMRFLVCDEEDSPVVVDVSDLITTESAV
jgi:hypothetical protein